MSQAGKQTLIQRLHRAVRRLDRPAADVHGDPFFAPVQLALMKEAQTGCQEGHDSRGAMAYERKCSCRPRLVVVFKKARQP